MKAVLIFIIITSMLLSSCSWTKTQVGWGIASTLATGLDAYSTTQALDNPDNYERYSLVMGKHPSDSKVYIYMGLSQLCILGVAHLVPSWRSWLLGGKTFLNTGCYINNERLE